MALERSAVLIHGAGGGAWEYDSWREVYEAGGYGVVARDLQPAEGGLENTLFSDYLEQVVSWTQGCEAPILIGASMGGILALKAAERLQPTAIVLINPVPPMGLVALSREASYPSVVKYQGAPLFETALALFDSDEETIVRAHRMWRDESGAVMNTLARGVAVDRPTCPVLVIASGDDREIPCSATLALAKEYQADTQSYAKMSHVGPLLGTRSPSVARASLAWLSGL